MTQRTALCGTTAILIALSGMAQADVTGAEVWENWKSAAESVGQTMTPGSVTQSGDTLTVSDLQISMELPEVAISGGIDGIKFRENGDGTVTISMSPSYTMSISPAAEGEDVSIDIAISHDALTMIASGSMDAITYDITATAMTVALENLAVDGEVIEMLAELVLSNIAGKYLVTAGEMTEVTTDLTASQMVINVDVNEPGGDGTFVMNLDYADIATSSAGSMMMIADPTAISAALAAGMRSAGALTHGAASFDVAFQDDSEQFSLNGTSDTGRFEVSLDADALTYAFGNTGLAFAMSGSEIPLPEIAASIGELGFGIMMPVAQSTEPQDFSLNVTLADLSVSDMIWGMIDGGGQLPHDPATLIVDVAGQANWLFDIFNPDTMMEVAGPMPGEIHSLDINQVKLAIAGAALTASGGFTFDMNNLGTFGGVPAPTGALDVKLVGGNGLMDTLVAMGLLPEDQAMGARMMMGLFTKPGDGDDTLVTKIEVDGATGAVSANGQRLQ